MCEAHCWVSLLSVLLVLQALSMHLMEFINKAKFKGWSDLLILLMNTFLLQWKVLRVHVKEHVKHRSAHVQPDRIWQEGCSGQECQTGSGLELDFLLVHSSSGWRCSCLKVMTITRKRSAYAVFSSPTEIRVSAQSFSCSWDSPLKEFDLLI